MPTLTSPSGKKEQGCLTRGGFASSWPKNSSHKKASLKSLKDYSKILQTHPEKAISTFMLCQNSFPNFKSCVNTDHGCWRPEAIIWGIQVKMFFPKLFDCEKRISLLNYLDNHLNFNSSYLYVSLWFSKYSPGCLVQGTRTPVTIVFLSDSEMNLMPLWYCGPWQVFSLVMELVSRFYWEKTERERERERKNVYLCMWHKLTFFGPECLIILLDGSQLWAINHQAHHFFREIFVTSLGLEGI